MTTPFPQCAVCNFFIEDETCEFFPNGIPNKFLFGREIHNKFEPIEEIKKETVSITVD